MLPRTEARKRKDFSLDAYVDERMKLLPEMEPAASAALRVWLRASITFALIEATAIFTDVARQAIEQIGVSMSVLQ